MFNQSHDPNSRYLDALGSDEDPSDAADRIYNAELKRNRAEYSRENHLQRDCPHTDTECGYCIECGENVSDDIVAHAEAAADAAEDR